ncbi:hypothetical protein [Sediminibacter sp. Hel_I_10]|uniref:hypothetical protein n=1 Tax=Sediminibacter sp. Hel_I_10 TaxID=1392490 RepID=UPI00047A8479|nr:hypothetical protein [Sediminibacter sp. Hel_I_10]
MIESLIDTIRSAERNALTIASEEISIGLALDNRDCLKEVINQNEKCTNMYKSLCFEFAKSLNQPGSLYVESDRIPFIAKEIFKAVKWNVEMAIDDNVAMEEALKLLNLEQIVYESKKLEIKANKFKTYLSRLDSFRKSETSKKSSIKNRLKIPQIALLNYYSGIHISMDNAKQIAADAGYNSEFSGKGLYQDYLEYVEPSKRRGDPGSERKLKNKIKLFKSLRELVSEKYMGNLEADICHLEKLKETHY